MGGGGARRVSVYCSEASFVPADGWLGRIDEKKLSRSRERALPRVLSGKNRARPPSIVTARVSLESSLSLFLSQSFFPIFLFDHFDAL